MINRMLKGALLALGIALASATPASAETPQTDVSFVEQLAGRTTHDVLKSLQMYYALHVSEIEVQLMREQNTGAFLAARRAEGDGDNAEAKRQMDIFESTKDALATARQTNQDLRQTLAAVSGLDFADDLAMSPDAPDALGAAPDGVPADVLAKRDAAWQVVEQARAHLREVRLQLLADQEEYDRTRKVKIGDSMRAMTRAEVAMARAACDLRLIEAEIAAATGKPVADALGGL